MYEARTPDGQRVAIKIISKKLSKAKKIEERVRYLYIFFPFLFLIKLLYYF